MDRAMTERNDADNLEIQIEITDSNFAALNDLQLALVGGGYGETILK